MSEEELGPAISSQLAEVAMKYWSEESKNPVVVTKILDGLKIPANCSGIYVPILNEAVAKNRKMMPFHKRADKRLSDIQKGLIFAASAVLKSDHLTLRRLWVTLLILLLCWAEHTSRYQQNVKNV